MTCITRATVGNIDAGFERKSIEKNISNLVPKKPKKHKKMNMVAGRLNPDNAEWLPHFLERTGAPQSKVLNESLRIAKEILERRLSSGEILFPRPADPPGTDAAA